MSFIPSTPNDVAAMLDTIGATDIEALFASIPPELRLQSWTIPPGLSQMSAQRYLQSLAGRNTGNHVCFMGGGFYDHDIPAAVDALAGRSEFLTAYTPYQPECSQGTLQAIYEYQSAVTRLTGMDVANASLYDGGTAVFEAATMAIRLTGRRRIVCGPSLNPTYRAILDTHTANLDVTIADGHTPQDAACVIVQNPGFRGTVRDFSQLASRCHDAGALLVMSVYPLSLGMLKTPGEMGADIAVAEGQSLGLPLGFGGPYLGMMATRRKYIRKMPGRLVAETQDAQGQRGFVLTLQAREQHIRREKAMSNICSNEAHCALRALLYLALLGKEGLCEVAAQCHAKAEYLKGRLTRFTIVNDGPTFNEFVVRLPRNAAEIASELLARGFVAGIPLTAMECPQPNDLLVAVTEKRTRLEIDAFVEALESVACS
ncbi:MAG TPA: aminomethyl-transferring glycine dehydrogenase subunit GcvPA [Candidatus Hydrogenedentes bacterium]|nr:aminomethyl-transferring glycine dehydrogenase subunit GcvPA [Candidatus Hydrogenedentota bacterium]HPG69573.1 aminomethyl-transferring glycine dehydrogenase subunit GcvPA [Candidatus Hydrogenedentota bacterium]